MDSIITAMTMAKTAIKFIISTTSVMVAVNPPSVALLIDEADDRDTYARTTLAAMRRAERTTWRMIAAFLWPLLSRKIDEKCEEVQDTEDGCHYVRARETVPTDILSTSEGC